MLKQKQEEILTPGVIAAMMMRTTESPRKVVLRTLPGCIFGFPPRRTRFFSSWFAFRTCSLSAAFRTQLPDSTFAMVRNPKITGRVMVGSGWAKVDNVKKLSESNGVGSTESLDKTTVKPTKRGSWVNGGIMIEGNGLHLYCLKSSFRRAVSCSD